MIENTILKKIAIVGLGPKGLYGLERLLANIANSKKKYPVEIHLFNKTASFGAGDIYNPEQPSYLLMNYVNGYINMWPDQDPKPAVPLPKSFVGWLLDHKDEFPEDNANTFSSRATVGRYLSEGFEALLQAAPKEVSFVKHIGDVIDIQNEGETYTLFYRESRDRSTQEVNDLHNILIATGHPCVNDPESLSQTNHVDFIYPVKQRLERISTGSKVAIKGMGLTFIDAILALTEGRNGRFKKNEGGSLTYIKSGLEPEIIYPFSKSGLMMIPRGNTFDNPSHKPFYFSKESLEFIEPLDGKYDFERELLPLIELEYRAVFYGKKFKEKGLELLLSRDFTEVEFQIENFHKEHPDVGRFSFQDFLEEPISDNNLHENTLESARNSILEAEIGVKTSPFAATADLWRHLSDFFNELYKFGGLKPQSQKIFLEKYAGHLNRISYGPPIKNMKKILAVAEAGLIDFSYSQNPEITEADKFSLGIRADDIAHADYLVDARIPKIQLHRCAGELFGNMLEKQLIHPYVNRQEGRLDYRPGCLSINEKGQPLDDTRFANESLTFVGTPSEGLTYDNDTLSRKRNDFVSGWAKDLTENILSLQTETQFNSNF
ncbi:FAD/NAD(P)-binding protein [Algoriphagus sp. D3-2-R+10]|uniref:FAD/NAD(P)-binding protein n=1 Tax=Algoriphagus aurantiacus TaxID=3103948 RepID=UPI002B3D29F8|nr:FAD/NAD(P)-binding protein [Algoriphagus sp. D3-2-R+10]MEB2778629.1 FAD/NAD(P)-binding protein [Algoriphagus sp. D3-2-R+10]